ncbi:hypothetical protein [Nocardiopsis baichengensis]|uniref:hypothetical protein n=1 Tax=Nocardiopsis baichengensis TaxID=280240 RepID=UPI0003458FC7|nr:hypothetical protein [Nocardiopsis baichengensis]
MSDTSATEKGERVLVRLIGPKAAIDRLLAGLPADWGAACERRFPAHTPGHVRVYLEVTPR